MSPKVRVKYPIAPKIPDKVYALRKPEFEDEESITYHATRQDAEQSACVGSRIVEYVINQDDVVCHVETIRKVEYEG